MRGLKIYLADGTYQGTVTMSSDSSKISAIRVAKENIQDYENELDGPGIYLLLVGSDAVYVGQTGLDTIQRRIMNTHSGDIDASWHTVLEFKFTDLTISSNELQFIEKCHVRVCPYTLQQMLDDEPEKGELYESIPEAALSSYWSADTYLRKLYSGYRILHQHLSRWNL